MSGAVPEGAELIVTINGPGEIAAWLTPLLHALKARAPGLRVSVCLLPCVFSSGAERAVLDALDGVDAAASVRDSYALILKGRRPAGIGNGRPRVLLHLGGEVVLSLLIARRLGAPAYAYAEARLPWQRFFRAVYFSGLTGGAAGPRAEQIGDLMVDAARLRFGARGAAPAGQGARTLALFPGSRDYLARHFLPFVAVALDALAARRPGLRFVMAKSAFIAPEFLRDFPAPVEPRSWPAHAVRYVEDGGGPAMLTERGTRIAIGTNAQAIAQADMAVTLPGTNTGEMAAAGLPMLTLLPTYVGEEVPLPGLAGHVGRIPWLGPRLKRWLAAQTLKRTPILALPNRRAGRLVAPELVGRVAPDEIVAQVEAMLDGDLAGLGEAVRAAMGPPGAADRLAGEMIAALADGPGR